MQPHAEVDKNIIFSKCMPATGKNTIETSKISYDSHMHTKA